MKREHRMISDLLIPPPLPWLPFYGSGTGRSSDETVPGIDVVFGGLKDMYHAASPRAFKGGHESAYTSARNYDGNITE